MVDTASSGSHEIERPARDQQPEKGAQDRKQERLAQQLHHRLPPAGANRQPDRHLSCAARRPREQEVGDVRTGDQQNKSRHPEQQEKRRLRLLVNAALPAISLGEGASFALKRAIV